MDFTFNAGTVLVALVGLLVGYAIRLHEVIRTERKNAYLKYLQAVDRLPHSLIEAVAIGTTAQPMEFAEEASRLIAEAEAEMSLTASRRVLARVKGLRDRIQGLQLRGLIAQTLGTRNPSSDLEREGRELAFLEGYWALIAQSRTDTVNAMRRDLRVRALPRSEQATPTWL
jgi:hypothetical protein